MMAKRGQVTLFVIIAIVVVAVALVAFLLYQQSTNKSETDVAGVKAQINDLLKTRILNDLTTVASQGGYSEVPEGSFPTPYYQVAYWLDGNETFYPSLKEVSSNVDYLNFLITDFNLNDSFQGYDISTGEFKSNTTILSEKVVVSINWPITIKKGSTTQTIENFEYSYNLRLGKLYDAAVYTADLIANDTIPNKMPPEINLTIYNYENTSLYELKDTNSKFKINNQSLIFVFAGK